MFLNRPVVRYTFVESRRFDTKRAREILPVQVIEALMVYRVVLFRYNLIASNMQLI